MKKIHKARIAEAEWDRHKEKIRRLYLDEKRMLESDEGVICLMERLHSFSATYVIRNPRNQNR